MPKIPTDVNPDHEPRHYCGRARQFVDNHPRTGWYLTVFLTLNFLLDLIVQVLDAN